MPKCSRQTNPKGVEICFEEESHRYTSIIGDKEVEYESGTTFIHRFFPVFDPDGTIAARCAMREGITAEEMRRRWRDKADRACRFGTKIHETIEDVLRGDMLRNVARDAKERQTMGVAVALARRVLEKMDIVGVEKIVFDSGVRIAGTMDLLARSKRDARLWILDHKTNERIERENIWGGHALPPIEQIPDANFWHYSLQLNLYEALMKRAGYAEGSERVGKALFHITAEGYETIPVGIMRGEVERMIDTKTRKDEQCESLST